MPATKQTMTAKNKAFWKLPKAKQRVAVAKDVLKQLVTGFYKAKTGDYLVFNLVKEDEKSLPTKLDKLFGDLKFEGASCSVCGIGSLFASMVKLGDNLSCKKAGFDSDINYEYLDGYDMGDTIMRKTLNKVFTKKQRVLIECAFEMADVGCHNENGGYSEKIPEYVNSAIDFGAKYSKADKRLEAIMNNIIKNKGEFIP